MAFTKSEIKIQRHFVVNWN